MVMLRYTERLTPLMVRLASRQHILSSPFLFFLLLFIFVTLHLEAFFVRRSQFYFLRSATVLFFLLGIKFDL